MCALFDGFLKREGTCRRNLFKFQDTHLRDFYLNVCEVFFMGYIYRPPVLYPPFPSPVINFSFKKSRGAIQTRALSPFAFFEISPSSSHLTFFVQASSPQPTLHHSALHTQPHSSRSTTPPSFRSAHLQIRAHHLLADPSFTASLVAALLSPPRHLLADSLHLLFDHYSSR